MKGLRKNDSSMVREESAQMGGSRLLFEREERQRRKGGIELKKKTLSMAILLVVLVSTIFSGSSSVGAFNIIHHTLQDKDTFTRLEALDPPIRFSEAAKKGVNDANRHQDTGVDPTFLPDPSQQPIVKVNALVSDYHCTRDKDESHEAAFDRCRSYIKSQRDLAVQLFETEGKTAEGKAALGRALHALQDFYSHSNYINLPEADQKAVKAALNDPSIPLGSVSDRLQITKWGIVLGGQVGTLWGLPIYYVAPKEATDSDDPLRYSHANHNYDDPLKSGFPLANEAAVTNSVEFIQGIWAGLCYEARDAITNLEVDPPPETAQRVVSTHSMKVGDTYGVSINYTGSASNLTVSEGLPYGVIPHSFTPTPIDITDMGFAYMVTWNFQSNAPLGSLEISYSVDITEGARTPNIAMSDGEPVPGYVNFYGSIIESGPEGIPSFSDVGGDQIVTLEKAVPVGSVGGIIELPDVAGLAADTTRSASTDHTGLDWTIGGTAAGLLVVVAAGTVWYARRRRVS